VAKLPANQTKPTSARRGLFHLGGTEMRIESDELYGALWQIGAEFEGEPLPRQEIIDRLAELKMVEIQPEGKPALTKYGERCYVIIESGEGDVPELEEPQPIRTESEWASRLNRQAAS
jgi:hypothetical protein